MDDQRTTLSDDDIVSLDDEETLPTGDADEDDTDTTDADDADADDTDADDA